MTDQVIAIPPGLLRQAMGTYRRHYRMIRSKQHGAGAEDIKTARMAARFGFFITYGKCHGMTWSRLWKGIEGQ